MQRLSPYLEELAAETAHDPRYDYAKFTSADEVLHYVLQARIPIDCLILQSSPDLQPFLDRLQQQGSFFPAVVIDCATLEGSKTDLKPEPAPDQPTAAIAPCFTYHPAVITLPFDQLSQLSLTINQAISCFLQLNPDGQMITSSEAINQLPLTHRLMSQQLRLAEKLKERLDYLGVYYKRNPQNFLRHMTPTQKEELLQQLMADYRAIILAYFSDEPYLNDKIDQFVNVAFFADVPVSQVVAIHMDLMDEFSKHLKLEGRNDEILLDYRLTLIDTLAHLCEMYRRSIPRES